MNFNREEKDLYILAMNRQELEDLKTTLMLAKNHIHEIKQMNGERDITLYFGNLPRLEQSVLQMELDLS